MPTPFARKHARSHLLASLTLAAALLPLTGCRQQQDFATINSAYYAILANKVITCNHTSNPEQCYEESILPFIELHNARMLDTLMSNADNTPDNAAVIQSVGRFTTWIKSRHPNQPLDAMTPQ